MRTVSGRPCAACDDALVERHLLGLGEKVAVAEEGDLGAVEPDAVGAVAMRQRQIAEQPDVGAEHDAAAVARHRRQRRAGCRARG